MIDTIVLTLSNDMFHISNPNKFLPSARWALAQPLKPIPGIRSKQNPTKKELHAGIYKPRLTLMQSYARRHPELILRIELSLPKLFFGNNFDELRYKDFAPLSDKLVSVLEQMEIITTPEQLAKAPISAIHYSKNILLRDGSTPYHYIQKIKEANIQLSLDVNQTDYRNDGHSYRWHCISYEVIFYDKIKDLEKAKTSDKRAIEKDNALQLNLFKNFQKRDRRLEVFRMEVRLNKRAKIKQLFAKLGIKADLTFKKLFKPAISKKILLYYLEELEQKRPLLLDFKARDSKALFAVLIVNNPDMSPKRIMQLFGLKKALEIATIRELKGMLPKSKHRSWQRLITEAANVKLPHASSPFMKIRKEIIKWKPTRFNKQNHLPNK